MSHNCDMQTAFSTKTPAHSMSHASVDSTTYHQILTYCIHEVCVIFHFIWTLPSDLLKRQFLFYLDTGFQSICAPVSISFGHCRPTFSYFSFRINWKTFYFILIHFNRTPVPSTFEWRHPISVWQKFPNVLCFWNWCPY